MGNAAKKKRIVFVIPQQHFDPVWRKPKGQYQEWRDYFISKLIEISRRYPEFTFAIGQAVVLRTYLADHPEARDYLRERIAKGKFEVVCGMEVIPDTNLPCGEAAARQALMGKRYAREVFGVEVKSAWYYDTFGLAAQSPQILVKSGFKWLHAIRFGRLEIELPCYWEGLDGTRILLHSKDYAHNSWEWFDIENSLHVFQNLKNDQKFIHPTEGWGVPRPAYYDEPNDAEVLWYEPVSEEETPSWRICQVIPEFNAAQDELEFRFGLPEDYFIALEKSGRKLPVVTGEMNPALTAVYTTRSWLKTANRRAEAAILSAEKVAAIARSFALDYPMNDLRDMWRQLLFTHHHDAICGCHIDQTDEELRSVYRDVTTRSERIIRDSLAAIGENARTSSGNKRAQPVVLFNTLSWDRDDVVSVELPPSAKFPSRELIAVGPDGRRVPALTETDEEGNKKLIFVAHGLPSFGYAVYQLQQGRLGASDLKVLQSGIENQHYQITTSQKGILSIWDKDEKRDLVESQVGLANELLCEEDLGGAYIGNFPGACVPGYFAKTRLNDVSVNPVYGRIVLSGIFPTLPWLQESKLEFECEVRLYSGLKRIDFITSYHWFGQQTRISAQFPTTIRTSEAHYEIPFGTLTRGPSPTSPLARGGDWPAQTYVSIDDGDFGITLINTGTCGVRVRDGLITMSLMNSPLKGGGLDSPYSCERAKGHGRHVFRYSLVSHKGNWQNALAFRRGWEVNHPVLGIIPGRHGGRMPTSASFISVSDPSVMLTAMKAAEDDTTSTVLRFLQATGKAAEVRVALPHTYRSIREVNLIENVLEGAAEKNGAEITASFGKFEIKTYMLCGRGDQDA